jgi:hypothetical protein
LMVCAKDRLQLAPNHALSPSPVTTWVRHDDTSRLARFRSVSSWKNSITYTLYRYA